MAKQYRFVIYLFKGAKINFCFLLFKLQNKKMLIPRAQQAGGHTIAPQPLRLGVPVQIAIITGAADPVSCTRGLLTVTLLRPQILQDAWMNFPQKIVE